MAGVEYDQAALDAVLEAIAGAMDDLGQEAAGIVYGLAPHRRGRYRRSIGASTYIGGRLVAGKHLRNLAKIGKADVQTVVYTSSPLGHLLERGTQPHYIGVEMEHGPLGFKRVKHPGSRPFPHFGPGAMATAGRAARIISAGIARRVR